MMNALSSWLPGLPDEEDPNDPVKKTLALLGQGASAAGSAVGQGASDLGTAVGGIGQQLASDVRAPVEALSSSALGQGLGAMYRGDVGSAILTTADRMRAETDEQTRRQQEIWGAASDWAASNGTPDRTFGLKAVTDPAWRAANPDLADEYDQLQGAQTLAVGGATQPGEVARAATQAVRVGEPLVSRVTGAGAARGVRALAGPAEQVAPEGVQVLGSGVVPDAGRALVPRLASTTGEVLPPGSMSPAEQAWAAHHQMQALQDLVDKTPMTAPEYGSLRARLVEARNEVGASLEDIEARLEDAHSAVSEADRAWSTDPRAHAGQTYDEVVGEPLA
jgi:hypothetical protein